MKDVIWRPAKPEDFISCALAHLRAVERHQHIDWHADDLKDRFYRAIALLESALEAPTSEESPIRPPDSALSGRA